MFRELIDVSCRCFVGDDQRTLLYIHKPVGCADSPAHFAVLTSDATWRLYSLGDLTRPEQQIKLQFRPSR